MKNLPHMDKIFLFNAVLSLKLHILHRKCENTSYNPRCVGSIKTGEKSKHLHQPFSYPHTSKSSSSRSRNATPLPLTVTKTPSRMLNVKEMSPYQIICMIH